MFYYVCFVYTQSWKIMIVQPSNPGETKNRGLCVPLFANDANINFSFRWLFHFHLFSKMFVSADYDIQVSHQTYDVITVCLMMVLHNNRLFISLGGNSVIIRLIQADHQAKDKGGQGQKHQFALVANWFFICSWIVQVKQIRVIVCLFLSRTVTPCFHSPVQIGVIFYLFSL